MIEGMKEYGAELDDPQAEFDRKVLAEQQVAQFESTLTDTDKLILQSRNPLSANVETVFESFLGVQQFFTMSDRKCGS